MPPPAIAPVFFQRCVTGAAAERLNFSPHRLRNGELLRPSANPTFHSSANLVASSVDLKTLARTMAMAAKTRQR
jgi:hypothetical protein